MKLKRHALTSVLAALMAILAVPSSAEEFGLLQDARVVAGSIPPRLLTVLQQEIEKGGVDGAIGVCRDKAPQMAKEASEKTGWQIRRVSLKNRNPKAVPDAWETAVLQDFDRRAGAGEDPRQLERGEMVSDNGAYSYRYMKALPTQQLCLSCHGGPGDIAPAVKARLAELYPADKATGYSLNQIRGAMTIRRAF